MVYTDPLSPSPVQHTPRTDTGRMKNFSSSEPASIYLFVKVKWRHEITIVDAQEKTLFGH